MKLFLTSSFSHVSDLLEKFYGETIKGKTITFIPTACNVESYTGYMDNDRKALEKLGIRVIELDVSKESSTDHIENIINKNDMIFIGGGNTFYLLQELRKSKADKIILEAINKNKLFIGVSAGSIITSPNIEYSKKMDDITKAPYLKNFDGLNLVDFYVLPHYLNEPFSKSTMKINADYANKINLIPINNTQVICVTGSQTNIISV